MRQKFLAVFHNGQHSPHRLFSGSLSCVSGASFKLLMWIRIELLILMRIRIRLLTLMRIRTMLPIKVMRSATFGLQILQGFILSLHAFILSIQCPPRLHFEPLKLRNFDFNVDPAQAFHSNSDSDAASKNNADPNSQS
jgi:hypothetical protein